MGPRRVVTPTQTMADQNGSLLTVPSTQCPPFHLLPPFLPMTKHSYAPEDMQAERKKLTRSLELLAT